MCKVKGPVYMYMVIESSIDTYWSISLADWPVLTGELVHERSVPAEMLSFYTLALTGTKAESGRDSVPSQGHARDTGGSDKVLITMKKSLGVEPQFNLLRSSKDYGDCPSPPSEPLVLFA
jgi:hypothetical protein